MLQRLRTLIQEAENLPHDTQVRQASIALIRITLQHVCISVAEWLIHNRNVSTVTPQNSVDKRLRASLSTVQFLCLARKVAI